MTHWTLMTSHVEEKTQRCVCVCDIFLFKYVSLQLNNLFFFYQFILLYGTLHYVCVVEPGMREALAFRFSHKKKYILSVFNVNIQACCITATLSCFKKGHTNCRLYNTWMYVFVCVKRHTPLHIFVLIHTVATGQHSEFVVLIPIFILP